MRPSCALPVSLFAKLRHIGVNLAGNLGPAQWRIGQYHVLIDGALPVVQLQHQFFYVRHIGGWLFTGMPNRPATFQVLQYKGAAIAGVAVLDMALRFYFWRGAAPNVYIAGIYRHGPHARRRPRDNVYLFAASDR